jgi:hypothetical protein
MNFCCKMATNMKVLGLMAFFFQKYASHVAETLQDF